MMDKVHTYPIAVSKLDGESDSADVQTARAISWLRKQPGGPIIVVTPLKHIDNQAVKRLINTPGVTHLSWRGLSSGSFFGHRVLHIAPDRQRLYDLWGAEMDALAVIERSDLTEWAEDVQADILLPSGIQKPQELAQAVVPDPAIPEDIARILDGIAAWAAGYDSGLKWNEIERLKADLMIHTDRWNLVTPDQVRQECRRLEMPPKDVDTVTDLVARRQQGGRFNLGKGHHEGFSH